MNQPPDPARWDIGNRLLSPSPMEITLTLKTDRATGHQEIIVTARTSTGTLTGTLTRDVAVDLAGKLGGKIAKMPAVVLARPGESWARHPNGNGLPGPSGTHDGPPGHQQ